MSLQSVLRLAIGSFGVLSNGLTILVFVHDPLEVFQRSSTYNIICLTIADLCTSVVAILWAVNHYFPSEGFNQFCIWAFWITIQASIYTLLTISVERYIAVVHPHKIRQLLTTKRIIIINSIVWFGSFLSSCLRIALKLLLDDYTAQFILILFLVLAILSFSSVYVAMVWKVKREFRQLEEQLSLKEISLQLNRETPSKSKSAYYRRLNLRRERRLLRLVLMLIAVLWLTVVSGLCLSLVHLGKFMFCKGCSTKNEQSAGDIMFSIELLNYAVNPILYAFRLPYYRKSLQALLFPWCKNSPKSTDQQIPVQQMGTPDECKV